MDTKLLQYWFRPAIKQTMVLIMGKSQQKLQNASLFIYQSINGAELSMVILQAKAFCTQATIIASLLWLFRAYNKTTFN